MPDFSNLSPIPQLPRPTEMSSLHSPRDSGGLYKLWQKIKDIVNVLNLQSENINQISREFKSIYPKNVTDFELFPFCIYQLPDLYRGYNTTQISGSTNWRTVRVRGGFVLTQYVSTGSFVNGTDGMQNVAWTNILPSQSYGYYDIQVPPSTPQYWFWIETLTSSLNNSNYILRYSTDPTSGSTPNNPNPWTSFPTASSTYIPIGYVDTYTSASVRRAFVRQMQYGDVVSAGSSSAASSSIPQFYTNWNPTQSYNKFDEAVLNDGSVNAGIYISLIGNNVGNSPQYPYPTTQSWYLKTFLPLGEAVCENTGKTIYIHRTPSF